ncbi:ribulose bisphosphate carboxylase small chain, chloroplastic-like [Ananas comosus]|uniref:Ribulose bisphosphate carboxylase small subunit, chloroplastic n=1 Tax=Ananas comosus TaxID=4615 RepID=A0A199UQQ7_ANACO|nr:ribulose bisphosphate carboxylase small chain, chloroplastic-like [Ananas comosus]OAY67128.1 Ribulose bisphosphate carboxylase small chain, chloroplastic [Ananas comosus]
MASSMMASTATVSRTAPAQANMVAPFTGLKSAAAFPATRRSSADLSHLPSNGGRVQCMKVWPIEGVKKFETLSYLPPLSPEALLKQIDYLLRSGWIPCLEFCPVGFVYREHNKSPGYYDGRYWTMWKLPMFGCTDATQVAKELEELKKEYPHCFARIIGFDNVRQVQCISFIAYKPEGKGVY